MSDALRAALDRDMAPVRHRGFWARAILPLGAIGAVTVSGLTLLGRPLASAATTWGASLALLATALGGLAMSLWRGPSGLGVPVRWRRLYLGGAAGVFALTLLARVSERGNTGAPGAGYVHVGTSAVNAVADAHPHTVGPLQNLGACASTTSVFAAVVAMATLWAARRTVPVSSGSMGSVIGASAGLAALAATAPSCAGGVLHTLAAHGAPSLLATVVCLFLGRRALAP